MGDGVTDPLHQGDRRSSGEGGTSRWTQEWTGQWPEQVHGNLVRFSVNRCIKMIS